MTTVYAIDICRKHKVRYHGIVHYTNGSETVSEYSMGARAPDRFPRTTRCGVSFDNAGETPAYLGDNSDIMVTCVACLGDWRRG